MPTETTVRAQQLHPGAPDEADYHAFCTALSESARGRAFLAEYARRNRNADTRPLLTAIERVKDLSAYTFHGDKYNDQSWTFTCGKGSYGARLYLCSSDNRVLRDRTVFRDYLRAHPQRAQAYAALKLRLMSEANDDWAYYTGGKTDFVRETLRLAAGEVD